MENKFPGDYELKEEDFSELWRDCIFVLDTNVLFNLYRYKISTRDELLKIFDAIKDRIWIPHQVALEFHDERLNVIKSLMAAYDEIEKMEKDNFDKIKKELVNYKERHPIIDVDKITSVLDSNHKLISDELKKEKSAHPDWKSDDKIKEIIYSLFDGKVGKPYSQKTLEEIYRRGEARYSLEIPPGYKDRAKKPGFTYKEYGDLVLWCQLIDESKTINKPVILITDDTKKDWFSERGIPRPELIQEFFSETENRLYIYSPKDFMKWSQQYLQIAVAEEAIQEIEKVKRGDEKYSGDAPSISIVVSYDVVDPLSPSEEARILELDKILLDELYKNPFMEEDDANLLASNVAGDMVKRRNLRVIIKNDPSDDVDTLYFLKKGRIRLNEQITEYI